MVDTDAIRLSVVNKVSISKYSRATPIANIPMSIPSLFRVLEPSSICVFNLPSSAIVVANEETIRTNMGKAIAPISNSGADKAIINANLNTVVPKIPSAAAPSAILSFLLPFFVSLPSLSLPPLFPLSSLRDISVSN